MDAESMRAWHNLHADQAQLPKPSQPFSGHLAAGG